jgi:predicted porin
MVGLNKKLITCSALLVLTLLNATAYGANFSYNYFDLLMTKPKSAKEVDDDNGFATLGSSPINKDYNAVFSYTKNSGEMKANKRDVEAILWLLGIEYHQPMPTVSDEADGYARVSYADISYDGPTLKKPNGDSDSDTGVGVEVGVRFKVSSEVEASLAGVYLNGLELLGKDVGDEVEVAASATYRFSKDVSAVVKTVKFEGWSFGARINF